MKFSIAITTYNRPANLCKLIGQIGMCIPKPETILVVDSSSEFNSFAGNHKSITYIRSSHKNQPYQRYLAYLKCKSEIIIFLDDDLEIIDSTVFEVMLDRMGRQGIRGVSVGFQHHNAISDIMESGVDSKSKMFKFINFISGVPILKPGKIYLVGLAGARLQEEGYVDYFNGAIMGFYRAELISLYDPILFSLFERKLGMGEDKVISMPLGLAKKLWFVPHHFFIHPPLESNYFLDVLSFQRKVLFSRLFISLQLGKHKRYLKVFIYFHYYYFASWRLMIAGIRCLIKPEKKNGDLIKGILQGVLLTFTLPFNSKEITPDIDWQLDAKNDTNNIAK
jgi:glycosyltransferase involved in cell wall biosynthesis